MNQINKYNISLRLVEESDADFIVAIRTDISKSRFISQTDSDIEKQKLWICDYKKREKSQEEFYFICIDEDGMSFATYRLYNKKENSIEIGSFVSKPFYDNPINVIKVDVILKSYVFEELNLDRLEFEVRKENKSVVNYHKKFHPTLINEDDLNYYFVLEKKDFLANRIKFEKLF
ncbi:GNAT family N-acetyltransferase [Flavobacterium sp. KACC 22763]|uniref:GNAT family N-acetyltransferase n=1 Tax=Flavobacterium sp. KACC 22763 TaxID=3025668 RepID=UPI0023666743|nr:GNAT family N-acetyltransferase [Flavobacterium sp. KACC 22763]WDF62903.1 GNAT family N-acetyltransferase [Flavobacterium sp. KACC 22763]